MLLPLFFFTMKNVNDNLDCNLSVETINESILNGFHVLWSLETLVNLVIRFNYQFNYHINHIIMYKLGC